ncbi:hypothetical protein [Streptomyces sp. NBC_00102]|nr:hypothetical protein [Streptomyces sp. NBC_00102]
MSEEEQAIRRTRGVVHVRGSSLQGDVVAQFDSLGPEFIVAR